MNHYTDFDRSLIRARNEQVCEEVHSLRLEKQLRKNRNTCLSRLAGLTEPLCSPSVERGAEWFRRTDGSYGTLLDYSGELVKTRASSAKETCFHVRPELQN